MDNYLKLGGVAVGLNLQRLYIDISAQFVMLLLVFVSPLNAAAEPLVIAVEDKDWAPYYTWDGDQVRGPCSEIVAGAFQYWGREFEFRGLS